MTTVSTPETNAQADEIQDAVTFWKTTMPLAIKSLPTAGYLIQVVNGDNWDDYAETKFIEFAEKISQHLTDDGFTVRISRRVETLELGKVLTPRSVRIPIIGGAAGHSRPISRVAAALDFGEPSYGDPESIEAVQSKIKYQALREAALKGVREEVLDLVPEHVARRYAVVPLDTVKGTDPRGTVLVAIGDPHDIDTIDSLRYILKRDVESVVAPMVVLEALLKKHYPMSAEHLLSIEAERIEFQEPPSVLGTIYRNGQPKTVAPSAAVLPQLSSSCSTLDQPTDTVIKKLIR